MALRKCKEQMTAERLTSNAAAIDAEVIRQKGQIGVRYNGQHTWHWWSVNKEGTDDEYLLFDHSYSQNTGSSKKSVRHLMAVQSALGFYSHLLYENTTPSLRDLNREINFVYPTVKLVKGRGYFYLASDSEATQLFLASLYSTSIGVFNVEQLTVGQWIQEVTTLMESYKSEESGSDDFSGN